MSEHEIRVGFSGDSRTVKVTTKDDDPRPWDLDSKLGVVGTDVPRADAVAKVTGAARYAFDVNLPGMLQGAVLRSPHARARLKSIDMSEAQKAPGVKAAIALTEPGRRLRYIGDEVAAVAAATYDQALDALEMIRVEYEVEPHVTDWLKSKDAPALDADGNVTTPWAGGAEAVEAGLAASAARVEATYRCEVQTHSSLESHGSVARWNGNGEELEIWASTQGTFGWKNGVARALNVPPQNVRVHAEFVGGGFGSKLQPGAEAVAVARLAKEAGAPVKLMMNRFEEHTCSGNRPSALMRLRLGADAEGKLTALDYQSWGGSGCTGGGGTSFPNYYLPRDKTRAQQKDLNTDTDGARAMRAPGRPQGFFALELALDELASKLGLDPLELRLRNDSNKLRQHEWRLGAERFGWRERRNQKPGQPRAGEDPRWLRGAGLSSAVWGNQGNRGARVTCRIHRDGAVETRNGAQDIGTGLKTVLAVITAEELQIPVQRVRATTGDTQDPVGPGSGGSTTTPTVAPAVRHAAALALRQLKAKVAEHLKVPAEQIVHQGGKLGVAGGTMLAWDEACKVIAAEPIEAVGERYDNHAGYLNHVCGCQFAEVAVDTWTGVVRVTRMLAVQDCGTLIDKKLAESQVLGGMIQGISYALHEERILDPLTGRMLNGDFSWYKIAGSEDVPPLDVVMVPVMNGHTNTGAMGLGEAPATAPAAAVASALFNAVGVPVRWLPITPPKVLRALAARQEAKR